MTGSRNCVISVITHDNLEGLRGLVPVLRPVARDLGAELIVVDGASSPETRAWLKGLPGDISVLTLVEDEGPAGSRNAVIAQRPDAGVYVFLDDDVVLEGPEVLGIVSAIAADSSLGIVSGLPVAEDGSPLTLAFSRRPFARAFPRLWQVWLGAPQASAEGYIDVDIVPGSAVAVRGAAARGVGGFETAFWPACFEDLDFCMKVKFTGWGVKVATRIPVHQKVSTTMSRVFGARRPLLCRSSGVLFAAVDYPLPFAIGRLLAAILTSIGNPSKIRRRGDAHGVIRCARLWRWILAARSARRRCRRRRNTAQSLGD